MVCKNYGYKGKEELNKVKDKINFYESNIIVYHRIFEEGGFLTDPRGEYFYIKKKRDSDCSIF